jgi:hypothetical protein
MPVIAPFKPDQPARRHGYQQVNQDFEKIVGHL